LFEKELKKFKEITEIEINTFTEMSQQRAEKIANFFKNYMLKEYKKIREEYNKNKDKNIIELINKLLINKEEK